MKNLRFFENKLKIDEYFFECRREQFQMIL